MLLLCTYVAWYSTTSSKTSRWIHHSHHRNALPDPKHADDILLLATHTCCRHDCFSHIVSGRWLVFGGNNAQCDAILCVNMCGTRWFWWTMFRSRPTPSRPRHPCHASWQGINIKIHWGRHCAINIILADRWPNIGQHCFKICYVSENAIFFLHEQVCIKPRTLRE